MPCDTITTAGIELGPNIVPGLLINALQSMGLNPVERGTRITFAGGWYDTNSKTMTLQGSAMAGTIERADAIKAEVKQAYGAELLKSQAKRYGWSIKETGKYKYAVTKRSF